MAFFSDNDPAQVLKDLLHIGLSNHSESADLDTLPTVRSAAESLLRLSSHGLEDGRSSSFAEVATSAKDAPDEQPENPGNSNQHIVLLGSDMANLYPIYGSEVEIVASRSSGLNQETQLSDKVSVSSIDKCDWKQQYYFGNLVAIHQSNSFVAYAVKEKANGVVKILNCETAQTIVLEGFAGSAVDVSFANAQDVILATVDETGDLRVFKIILAPSGQLLSKVLLHLQQFDVDLLDSGATDLCCRVVWCPFVPENKDGSSDEAEDILKAEMFLAFSCNNMVRVLNVEELRILYGGKPVDIDDLKSGCCVIDSHLQPVFDMALVPDGSTLATASADGFIRFHEVDLSDYDPPKLLFEWKPHDGQPVSLIAFVDDLKNTSSDVQWWKFAITGVDQNREWKLWSCETWTCLQTLTFSPSPYVSQQFQVMPCIKARLDASATYLVLSDIMRKALYVLRIERGDVTRISSVAEFLLVQPCLGLAIEDVVAEKKPLMADHLPELLNSKLEFPEQNEILSLYTVQTKGLELLKISLTTPAPDVHIFPLEFQADPNAADDVELSSPSVVKRISLEDGRNSLEIVPSESSSFTQVTSMDEGDHLIDIGSRTRILTNSSAAAEMSSRDLNHAAGNRPSTELSQALAHISSIQLPAVHTGFDNKSKISNGLPLLLDSVVSSSGEFPYSVRSSSSGARAKEHSVSSSTGDTYRIEEDEPFRFHSLLNEEGGEQRADSSQNFVISSYSDVSVASEHRSERNDRSSSEWLRSEPLFHDRAEIAQNENLKEDVNSSPVLKDFLAETRDVKFGVKSPRVHQQPSDFQPESEFQPESFKLTLSSSSHSTHKSSAIFVGAEDKKAAESLEILKMLKEQLESVEQLRDSVCSRSNVMSRINDLQADVANLEKLMLSGFQDTVGHFQKDKNEFAQQITGNLETLAQQQLHQQQGALSQIVRNCLQSELRPSIEYEMHHTVVPGISAIFDPIGKKLTEELAQKLTATDTALKDNVRQMVRSKTMTEVIGKVVSNNLETVLQATCRDILIPAFSRGFQNVLCQVNETFQKGLNIYMLHMQNQAEKLHIQSNEAALSPVLHQLHGAVAGLVQVRESRNSLDRQLADLVESVKQRTDELERQRREQGVALTEAVNSISDQLMASVQDLIHKEMTSALKQHQESLNEKIVSTLQSRSSTPAPQLLSSIQPLRTQIVGLVQRNHMNAAFQQALSAMDLSVVMFLCEIVNPDKLFSGVPFPLDQPVLLSLVQQLSADLRTQTSLKCRYLEEALLNVDQKSAMMKEHLPAILEQLCANADVVQQVQRLDPSLRRSTKRLIMTAKCLCHSLLSSSDDVFN